MVGVDTVYFVSELSSLAVADEGGGGGVAVTAVLRRCKMKGTCDWTGVLAGENRTA